MIIISQLPLFIAVSCGVGRSRGLDPALLWPWSRPEDTSPIRPLTWEPPYAVGVALEKAKKKSTSKAFAQGIPIVGHQVKTLISIHEDGDSIPGLTQWVKDLALPQAVA